MSDEMNVKFSAIRDRDIRKKAKNYDENFGNNDNRLSKEEGAKLASLLNGDLQAKLAKESDEVKSMFGLKITTPAETTQAVVANANQAIGNAAKKTYRTPFEEVKARFLQVLDYNKETNTSNGTTTKDAYKAVKKEFKGKGKEYDKAIKELKYYAKHDFVDMRHQKTLAKIQAYDKDGRLVNEENLQYDSSKKVNKRERELTIENNNGVKDRWALRAIRNNNVSFLKKGARFISGNRSAGKIDQKGVAAGNRAVRIREKETFTLDAMKEALGEKNPLVQEYTDNNGKKYPNVLVATGLVAPGANGEYSVKDLSKVVGNAVGADNTLNDHDNHNESELQATLTKLYQSLRANGSRDFKTSELRDKDVRRLVRFLGYEDDRMQLAAIRFWQSLLGGAAVGGASGAAAGAVRGGLNVDIQQRQEVNLSLEGFTDEQKADFINAIKADNNLNGLKASADYGSGLVETTVGNITETALGIYIAQDQMVSGTVVSALKSIAMGAAAGAGVGAVAGILAGLGHAREREVLGMVFDCDTTYEEIIDTIDNAYSDKNLSPQMKAALKEVAKLGIVTEIDKKTGARKAVLDKDCNTKWDFCQFMEEYNRFRGNQIYNAAEVRAAARMSEKVHIEIPDCEEVVEEECIDCPTHEGDKQYKIPPHAWNRQGGETWIEIVKAKYPCLVEELDKAGLNIYSGNGAIKVMQRALATDEDGNFHKDEFRAIISGDIPKHIDFPDEIEVTVNGKTITCKYEDNEIKRFKQNQLGSGTIKANNNRFGYGRKGNLKTYTNDCYPGIQGEGPTAEAAVADFNKKVAAAQAQSQK